MSRGLPLPYLPLAPDQYDVRYMNELVRAVDTFMRLYNELGEGTFSNVRITDLQNGTDQGLDPGVLFRIGDTIYVTLANKAVLTTNTAVGSIGEVTVVTS